jgi:hypothetical protein
MSITKTPQVNPFPAWNSDQGATPPTRYAQLPTPEIMRNEALFGLPLRSFFTGQTVTDSALQSFIDQAVSEVEHTLDMYVTPVTFEERHDFSRELQLWSNGYLKVSHSPILSVESFQLTFTNGLPGTTPMVDVPLEFIHVQAQEGTIQLVPAQGTSVTGFVASIYSGLGFHAFSAQGISNFPGAVQVRYTCGFPNGQLPALLAGLIQNIAAFKFLSIMGPILFPYNSTSIGIDGTSQSVGTLGPAFLQNRIGDLEKIIQQQMEAAKGYYQKRFLIDYI